MNEVIVFAGGCFWCTEALFQQLKGVVSVMPGYTGGITPHPTYESVCSGSTGHTEALKIEFDSSIMSFRDLLTVFFATHDPTTLNRQGADVGTQYRSAIFYATEEQKTESEKFIQELNEQGPKIVTAVQPLGTFYPAEQYHRNYFEKNPDKAYCQVVINPKLEKLKSRFNELLK